MTKRKYYKSPLVGNYGLSDLINPFVRRREQVIIKYLPPASTGKMDLLDMWNALQTVHLTAALLHSTSVTHTAPTSCHPQGTRGNLSLQRFLFVCLLSCLEFMETKISNQLSCRIVKNIYLKEKLEKELFSICAIHAFSNSMRHRLSYS